MDNQQYEQTYKTEVINFFNRRTRYDNDYTISRALPLLELIPLRNGQKVLDVATGTGIMAIASAEIVGSTGKVIGVDFSSGMLAQAQQKINKLGLQNIELIEADAEYIDFEDESFDVILCSTSVVYFQNIPAALAKWYHFLKKGGIVGFSCCSEESFEAPAIIRASAKNGISLVSINEPTGTIQKCHTLMQAAGFEDIEVKTQQFGFYRSLEEAKAWNGGWFHPRENPLLNLSSAQMEALKAEYCREIEAKATEEGVWYEHLIFFVSGRKKSK